MRGGREKRRSTDRSSNHERLIERARAGQPAAVTELYEAHVAMVHGYLRACGVPDAEDLTSEVFVGMLRNIEHFEGDAEDFRRWLMTIAHRRMVDTWRRERTSRVSYVDPCALAHSADVGTVELEAMTMDQELIGAFRTLTESQREVLALRFIADLSIEHVAIITDRPTTAVKSLQHRGLESVKRQLSPLHMARGA